MKLKLIRKWKKEGYTIGQLYVDGEIGRASCRERV